MENIDQYTEVSLMRAAIARSRLSAAERAEALAALSASETIVNFLVQVCSPSKAARKVLAKGGDLKPRRPGVEA